MKESPKAIKIADIAHSIKGSSSNLGVEKIAKYAAIIEKKCSKKNINMVSKYYYKIKNIIDGKEKKTLFSKIFTI